MSQNGRQAKEEQRLDRFFMVEKQEVRPLRVSKQGKINSDDKNPSNLF